MIRPLILLTMLRSVRKKFYGVLWASDKAGASDKTLCARKWWLCKPFNCDWEVAVLQPTPMKLSKLFHLKFNSDRPRQHTTTILVVHIVLSVVYSGIGIAFLPCDIWWHHVHWIPPCHENLSIVTRCSFPPSPCAANVWPMGLPAPQGDAEVVGSPCIPPLSFVVCQVVSNIMKAVLMVGHFRTAISTRRTAKWATSKSTQVSTKVCV